MPKVSLRRRGEANLIVGVGIAAIILVIVAFIAMYVSGELYVTLPSSVTGLSFVQQILSAIGYVGPVFNILFIVLIIVAFLIIIMMFARLGAFGGGGAVAAGP